MSYGTITCDSTGDITSSPYSDGGVFIELYILSVGGTLLRTYTNLKGMQLRVHQVSSGSFTWALGTDINGFPTITFTALPTTRNGRSISLLVFAI